MFGDVPAEGEQVMKFFQIAGSGRKGLAEAEDRRVEGERR